MKTKIQSLVPASAVIISAVTAVLTYSVLAIVQPRWLLAIAETIARFIMRILALGLIVAWLTPELPAQEAPPEPLPIYPYDFTDSLGVSMPQAPVEGRSPIIAGAVCFGVFVGVVGWLGVKIISACLKNHELVVTNNAACGECPAEAPIPPSIVPSPTGPPHTADCGCGAPPAAGQPLPLRIQHSFDGKAWSDVATGVGIGSTFDLPDTGYWRAVPMFASISSEGGVLTVHSPPGVLEFSADLREWSAVGTFTSPNTDLVAQAGFYRVRLN